MIRKLTENDRPIVMQYLLLEPSFNVFMIGDIENFGFDSDFQDVWADFNELGKIDTVILRYYTNYIVYAQNDTLDYEAICDFLKNIRGNWMLSGKESIVKSLSSEFECENLVSHCLAEIRTIDSLPQISDKIYVEWATEDNFDDVLTLHKGIEEFERIGGSTEAILFNMKSGTGRTTIVSQGKHIVASASSAAENKRSAMVIGVCTNKEYRQKGFATACMTKLCYTLLCEKKVICLFYNNPVAARIYKKIGFCDIGYWAMASMES